MRGVRCEASTSLLFPLCVRWGKSVNVIKHHHAQKKQPIITMITGCTSYPRRESNPDLRFRKPSFYPLNYGGIA